MLYEVITELKFSDGGSVTVDSYYSNSARFFKAVGEQLDSIGYQLTDKQKKWFTRITSYNVCYTKLLRIFTVTQGL